MLVKVKFKNTNVSFSGEAIKIEQIRVGIVLNQGINYPNQVQSSDSKLPMKIYTVNIYTKNTKNIKLIGALVTRQFYILKQ